MESPKSALIEKIIFAVIPFIFTGLVYLISALNETNTKLAVLENKIAVVVTPENTPRPNQQSELAREKMRQDFMNEQNENIVKHTENKSAMELLKWRIEKLEEKNGKWLDTGTKAKAKGVNTELEAVAKVHRGKNSKRQSKV